MFLTVDLINQKHPTQKYFLKQLSGGSYLNYSCLTSYLTEKIPLERTGVYSSVSHWPIRASIFALASFSCGGSDGESGYMLAQWAVPSNIFLTYIINKPRRNFIYNIETR